MKFDQAIKEGFENYVSEDESQISIGRDVLESIRDLINDDDVVKIAVEKHRDKPELFKAINKLIFKVDSLLVPKKEEFPGKDEEDESVKMKQGAKEPYDVDKAVEKHASQAGLAKRLTGAGTRGQAYKAVGRRDKLVKQAINAYDKNTKEIEQALKDRA